MTPKVVATIARLTRNFAETCYRHNYGCVQSVRTYRVNPIPNVDVAPYVRYYQQYTNTLIQSLIMEH
jgi:hypothetical protein